MQDRSRHNNWWVVVGSVLGLIVGNGPVLQFTFGLFIAPVSQEMGWSRGTISLGFLAAACLAAVASPCVGLAIDRWGVRKITLAFILLFSASTASIALSTTATSFILLFCLAGLFSAGQAPLPYARAISSRFDDKRGLALGVAMTGVGLGTAIIPQIAHLLIESWGWRGAYVGLALLTLLVAFPSVALLVDDLPGERAAVPQQGVSLRAAARDRRFYLIAAAVFLVAAATNGIIAHLIPLLTDRGISTQRSSIALSVAGIALIGGRLFAGYLLDRIFAPFVAFVFFLVPVFGIALLSIGGSEFANLAGVCLVGLGLGAEVDLIAFLLSRYFGLKSFGQLYGILFLLFATGSGIGPFVMGKTFDLAGSYEIALGIFCACLTSAAAMMLFLGPYTFPAERGIGLEVKAVA